MSTHLPPFFFFFFFNDTATTEIYTLSLHDALPICGAAITLMTGPDAQEPVYASDAVVSRLDALQFSLGEGPCVEDRKSTRLNSSHGYISYAVFCLKKKKKKK